MKLLHNLLVDRWGERDDYFDWRIDQEPLDIKEVEGVCLLHLNDKLGDGLLYSLLVDALAMARPELPVDVVTRESFVDYWAAHPGVRNVAAVDKRAKPRRNPNLRQILQARKSALPFRGRFDLVVSFESFSRPEHFAFLDGLAPGRLVGFSKHAYRRFDYSLEEGRHGVMLKPFADRVLSVMRVFGLQASSKGLKPHVPLKEGNVATAKAMVSGSAGAAPRLLFSVYGGSAAKVLSPEKVALGVRKIREAGHEGSILLSVPRGQNEGYASAVRDQAVDRGVEFLGPTAHLFDLFALIDQMDAVVSIDSGVAHVAAALGKPQLAIFAQRATIPTVWRPLNDRCLSSIPPGEENANAIDWDEFGAHMGVLVGWMAESPRAS